MHNKLQYRLTKINCLNILVLNLFQIVHAFKNRNMQLYKKYLPTSFLKLSLSASDDFASTVASSKIQLLGGRRFNVDPLHNTPWKRSLVLLARLGSESARYVRFP